MKKLWMLFGFSRGSLSKLVLKMKLLAFLMFAVLAVSAADSYSQAAKFSLKLKDATVREVFDQIEENSEFILLYNEKWVDVNRRVDINVKNETVEKILDQVFKGTRNVYKIYDRQVVILQDEKAEIPANVQRGIVEAQTQQPQQKEIAGKITDTNGLPLPGVSVIVKGTTVGTVTNNDGEFSLNIPLNAEILQFSFVGMRTQEISIDNRRTINLSMQEETMGVDEVVVVGYGTQKKVNLTGSVQTIRMDEAVNKPVSNAGQLMYGKFSGVNITQNSGLPGSDASSIVIRGVGTFGNSTPLVVIDGMQFEGMTEFNRMSPSDIQNITVLKDASAVAIYGARGANGVILVETKKGVKNKFTVEYNNYFGTQQATVLPEFADAYEYATLMNEALVGWAGGDESAARYTPEDLQQIKDGSNPDQFANTNWVDVLLQSAPIQNHHLSISGGEKKTQYRLGIGYLSQGSILVGKFNYDRLNFNLNINSTPLEWLSFDNTLLGSWTKLEGPSNHSGRASIVMKKMALSPTIPVKYSNGYYGVSDGTFRRQNYLTNQHNPVEEGYIGDSFDNPFNINDRLSVTISPISSLSLESAVSVNLNFTDASNFVPGRTTYWWDGSIVSQEDNNTLSNSFSKQTQWLWENILRYNLSLQDDNHNFSFILGHSANYFETDNFNGSLQGFPTENLHEFNAGGTLNPNVSGNRIEHSLQSVFGRINYNFRNKYLFEANFRRDGSSKFGPGNRFANFPSISAGWLLSEEEFFKNSMMNNTMNYLKLRASWGRTGNNRIGNYIWDQTYNTGIDYILGAGSIASGVAITNLANEKIKWETTEQYNIGLDAGFFDNKLAVGADFFNRNSYDVLYTNFPVPSTLGVSNLSAQNSAEVLNNGVEVNLNYQKRGDFSFNVGVNFTKMFKRSEVVDLGTGIETISGITIITEGEPYRAYYGYQWAGIFQSEEEAANAHMQFGSNDLHAGDVHYADVSGPEGNPDGKVDADDRVVIGNPHPEWMYGANANMSYKGFDMDIAIQGLKNVDRFIQDDPTYGFETQQWNAYKYWINRWTEENPSNKLHRIGGNKSNNIKPSAQFVEDGSYLRVKNIELGYSIPPNFTSKFSIKKIRIFVSGQNLLTFTKMNKNLDPERNMGNINTQNVPIYKIYSAGVNIIF